MNHCHALALYFVWYNFCRQHKSLGGVSPAMAFKKRGQKEDSAFRPRGLLGKPLKNLSFLGQAVLKAWASVGPFLFRCIRIQEVENGCFKLLVCHFQHIQHVLLCL